MRAGHGPDGLSIMGLSAPGGALVRLGVFTAEEFCDELGVACDVIPVVDVVRVAVQDSPDLVLDHVESFLLREAEVLPAGGLVHFLLQPPHDQCTVGEVPVDFAAFFDQIVCRFFHDWVLTVLGLLFGYRALAVFEFLFRSGTLRVRCQ